MKLLQNLIKRKNLDEAIIALKEDNKYLLQNYQIEVNTCVS